MKLRPQVIFVVASAAFLILSYPDPSFTYLAWIGLIPIFFAIDGTNPRKAFLLAYVVGAVFFLGTIWWLIHVTLPGMIIVTLYLALYFGLFGLLALRLLRLKPIAALFSIPAAWVACEWLRSTVLTGFGWNLLGYSQSPNLVLIQIADILGVYGVSFMVAMANVAAYLVIKNFGDKKIVQHLAIFSAGVFLACFIYGLVRLSQPFAGEEIKVSLVQGNIPQIKKWDASFREAILSRYETLSREVSSASPDLIVWPETSVPGFLESERYLMDRVKNLARELNVPILVGAPSEDRRAQDVYYNSAMLFSEDGSLLDRYDKIHLVPFGEYVPFKKALSFVERFAPSPIGDFSPGAEYKVFSFFVESSARDRAVSWRMLKKARCAVLICFEDIFPGLARRFVSKKAEFLVNITNDAWFGLSSAPYQHAQASVFRAVENRTFVVRAANTGLSCIIDSKGRMTDRIVMDGRSIFVPGYVTGRVRLSTVRTFYTTFGDMFAYICVLSTLILCLNFYERIRARA